MVLATGDAKSPNTHVGSGNFRKRIDAVLETRCRRTVHVTYIFFFLSNLYIEGKVVFESLATTTLYFGEPCSKTVSQILFCLQNLKLDISTNSIHRRTHCWCRVESRLHDQISAVTDRYEAGH